MSLKKATRRISSYLALFGAALLPLFLGDPYVLQTLSIAYVFAIYAMSWNLLALSGQASLGHAAFFGIGAYASVILSRNLTMAPFLTIFVGPILAAFFGLGLGLLCFRLREWFLAMVTFGFAVIVQTFVVDDSLRWLTNGWDGLFAPPLFPLTLEPVRVLNYYFILGIAVGTYTFTRGLFGSKIGLALRAIRDNELVARVSGVCSVRYKLIAFVLSTYIAGVAGAVQYHAILRHLSPEVFHPQTSFWPLIFTLAGGIATPEGPFIGAVTIWLFWEVFRGVGGFLSLIVVGLALALVIIFLPGGITSVLRKSATRF